MFSCSFTPLCQKMSKLSTLSLFLFILAASANTSFATSRNDSMDFECLKVPISQFIGSLKSTIDIIQDMTTTISNFGNFFDDFRLSNAISDCLDLLDFSADELSWTISASMNPIGRHDGTGDLSSDLRTWLSAAVVNQDTCIEGLSGTNTKLKSLVEGGLNQITSMVQELLTMVDPTTNLNQNKSHDQFPSWFREDDRKLLLVNGVKPDVIVALDGTGNFTRIMDAVISAPEKNFRRYIIYVKKGVYNEYVEINKKKWNLMMVGDGMNVTLITGNRNRIDGWHPFGSATFVANGIGFIARDITFENTAGPTKEQAVALRSDSDLSVFYRCELRGYQDSLYTHSMRQFYRECTIRGTVDFIFGSATAVFQNCQLLARKGLPKQKNTITAHGRKNPDHPTGYSIQFCNISADIDLLPYVNSTYTYLGRPWKNFSRTIIMQSNMSDAVSPEGWLEWNGDLHLDTLYYGEYMNYGPGALLNNRIKWPGYHILNTSNQATNFTVAQFIQGNLWLPSTGVTYTAGLEV